MNGRDRGPVGFPLRVNHAAEDARHRKLGMACLVVVAGGILLGAMCCGGALAWMWL
jgi:hypothetical protein